ncbi:hypothetical protein SynPROS91_00224 [Synechococcus sp. PROS-9-1]|nr:hypothetical protein SynPROS91_00224 [Synechococcus sp. PROS-9-1]
MFKTPFAARLLKDAKGQTLAQESDVLLGIASLDEAIS